MVKLFVASLKKAVRNRVESRDMKFWASDAVGIGMVVVWISFRLDDILPSSGKCPSSSTMK